jgi:hypothetical protein
MSLVLITLPVALWKKWNRGFKDRILRRLLGLNRKL